MAEEMFYNPESDMFATRGQLRDYYRFSAYYESMDDDALEAQARAAGLPESGQRFGREDLLASMVMFGGRDPGIDRAGADARVGMDDGTYDDALDHARHHGLLVAVGSDLERDMRAAGAGRGAGPNEAVLAVLDRQRERGQERGDGDLPL